MRFYFIPYFVLSFFSLSLYLSFLLFIYASVCVHLSFALWLFFSLLHTAEARSALRSPAPNDLAIKPSPAKKTSLQDDSFTLAPAKDLEGRADTQRQEEDGDHDRRCARERKGREPCAADLLAAAQVCERREHEGNLRERAGDWGDAYQPIGVFTLPGATAV